MSVLPGFTAAVDAGRSLAAFSDPVNNGLSGNGDSVGAKARSCEKPSRGNAKIKVTSVIVASNHFSTRNSVPSNSSDQRLITTSVAGEPDIPPDRRSKRI